MNNAMIFDFETLSQDQIKGVVTCMALITFDELRFTTSQYEFMELVDSAKIIKLNVEDQVKTYMRSIDKSTLEWWDKQPTEAKKWIKPSDDDVRLTELYDFMIKNKPDNLEKVYTRGNTFDPIFLEHIMKDTGDPMPYDWWQVRDTRSVIDGLAWGSDLDNKFIPPKCDGFVKHDPRHDVALDVMRIQALVEAIS
tara:strand:+ start:339 stop:923 length:585 start_codon:yes stop_codon:yes gene_type:complete